VEVMLNSPDLLVEITVTALHPRLTSRELCSAAVAKPWVGPAQAVDSAIA
jgi:hypothetical protein